ncbi:acetyl-CoA carboxylase carboxyltransferase subunit alpha [Collinsella tanakaei]|uniref:acetyl-CoA carboxylase carboxyltransferase subunit alpha n=1 Tax=Collinsella tanakaei TaxID=626935 RepID=UPI0025A41CA1|nr:acetyl-CoA carboxylase carboxyltransferase subunit alpha [Collinsella tanakaei]MDM8246118.1 acetyl-CoA carboxylase carboxyltransferase subunit alpha [Collinsella tanakaei]
MSDKTDTLAPVDVLTAAQRVAIARHPGRPGVAEIIDALFTDFFEQRGDRSSTDDPSIMGGIARFHGRPVTVLGNRKGADIEERVACNFGMASPEGYRKAQRIMLAAQKFGRPILTFVDTSGAYPGLEAEEHGQGEAIARSIELMSSLTVPVISVICGEGGSGGALALAVGNRVIMLENAVYSVLSPEGFASILWKDSSRADEACEVMKLTADDLLELGIIDGIIPEPAGGAHENANALFQVLDTQLTRELEALSKMSPTALANDRYRKFRAMGATAVKRGRI